MPANPTTQRMGELHEEYLAGINGGTKSRSSGNQWFDQGDGRDNHDDPFAFCWDGKSTRGKQIAVTLDMITKIREQAQGERPQIGLRWYGNDLLDKVTEDWIAITADDFAEMKEAAMAWALLQRAAGRTVSVEEITGLLASGPAPEAADPAPPPAVPDDVARELERLREACRYYKSLAEMAAQNPMVSPIVPRLPWTVIYQVHRMGSSELGGMHYDENGHMTPVIVRTARVERSMRDKPRLIVNDIRLPEGDLYIDGVLMVRASEAEPGLVQG